MANRMTYVRALVLLALLPGCGKGGPVAAGGTVGSTGSASTAGTAATIQQRIAADKPLAGATIKVSEQGGTIALDGTVASQAQKDRADEIVYQVQKEKGLQTGDLNNLLLQEGAAKGGSGGGQ